mgnify:CR=1 FL=1
MRTNAFLFSNFMHYTVNKDKDFIGLYLKNMKYSTKDFIDYALTNINPDNIIVVSALRAHIPLLISSETLE